MNLIIASNADSASINLRDRLLEMSSWIKCGEYDGNDMWEITEMRGDYCVKGTRLVSINKLHINAEKIDETFEKENESICTRTLALWKCDFSISRIFKS